MKVLVLNSGSSSIKYKFIEMENEDVLCNGKIERIGLSNSIVTHIKKNQEKYTKTLEILEHSLGLQIIFDLLIDNEQGVITSLGEIGAIGHRVVHGGEHFSKSVLVTDEVVEDIIKCIELAPLHNPHNLKGIVACKEIIPGVKQVAVFDTAYHQTLEPHVYLYALPYVLYKRHSIRRYGFHGTSHCYVARISANNNNVDIEKSRIITCHLGNGSSITAIKNGKSIDTSMGFTPLEGLIMGTRCGDIDPAIILHVIEKEELTVKEANSLMNKHSGLIGISGMSNDLRELIEEMKNDNERAKLAVYMFCYRLKKYISSYLGILNGADLIVLTGGIGENSPVVRKIAFSEMENLGIIIDDKLNDDITSGKNGIISAANSKIKVEVILTNEELVIARDTVEIIKIIGGN